jgi:hypothetical protein
MQVKSLYPHGYHKTDKNGRPIYIEIISKVNLTDLFKVTTEERMMKNYVKGYERLMNHIFPSCSKSAGKLIEQSLTILDMKDIGMGILVGKTKEFLKIASDIGQNYYPEMLGDMFLINTSFMFSAVYSVASAFIDEKTRKKIHVEKSGYAKKLLELVDAENLPEFFGGKCTCSGIEGGCLYADIGPWNPKGGMNNLLNGDN